MDSQSQWPTQNDLPEKVRSGAIDKLLWKVEAHVQGKD
jgi:hypothetical protein